jgi:hypothetical protein
VLVSGRAVSGADNDEVFDALVEISVGEARLNVQRC